MAMIIIFDHTTTYYAQQNGFLVKNFSLFVFTFPSFPWQIKKPAYYLKKILNEKKRKLVDNNSGWQ